MLRAIATWFAKWKYVWNKETEAGMHTWSARVAEMNAQANRDLIAKLKQDADALDARIKQVAEMEEKGYWLCDNGHEPEKARPSETSTDNLCPECGAKVEWIRRENMTGQEKYESDKDRKDAEKLLAARREEIGNKETEAGQQEATGKYFRQQAESGRRLADSLRKL